MALPIPDAVTIAGVTCFCVAMAGICYRRRIFDLSGSLSALVVGMAIGICGSVLWLVLLLIFLVSSFAATRYRFEWKKAKGFQEGRRGERSWRNIAANGAIPTVIAVASFVTDAAANGDPDANMFPKDVASFLFISAIAVAAADTAASEIGIIDPRVYIITTLRRVKQGVDGGVSLTGTLVAFVAAAYTSTVAYVVFAGFDTDLLAGPRTLLIPMLCGFLGCQVDSVIGATWEQRGRVGKLGNNFLSIGFGTLLALLFALGSL
ncbi:MAG: DUF92 domain-containing protein [Methanobacteriota archaeon]|nr:MAG: DUF92 domain-containing protein [Euryarchaeota archaeon]